MTSTSEVLNLAADLIEERGWARGNCGMAVTGPTCLEGALAAVLKTPVRDDLDRGLRYRYSPELQEHPAYLAIRAHLAERHSSMFLWAFNDTARDGSEVIEVLRAAAAIEQAKADADQIVTAAASVDVAVVGAR